MTLRLEMAKHIFIKEFYLLKNNKMKKGVDLKNGCNYKFSGEDLSDVYKVLLLTKIYLKND